MSYDPKSPHYDPYTALPGYGNQPTSGGYPDYNAYQGSAAPQQGGYPDPYSGAGYGQPQVTAYNTAGFTSNPYYAPAPDNGTGVAALVLGILSLLACGLCSIPAVICGHMALKKADNGTADNRGMAVAGLVMGYIGCAFLLIAIIYVIIVFVAIGTLTTTTTNY